MPVTVLLRAIEDGDGSASEELYRRLQEELRGLARVQLDKAGLGNSWQPTALVNQAWLRLAKREQLAAASRRHFFFTAARAMHDVVVEEARKRSSVRRGGRWKREDLELVDIPMDVPAESLLALDEAFDRLERHDSRCAEVVRLRFFAGLSEEEVAGVLEISLRTVQRDWRYARVRLMSELLEIDEGES